MMPPLVTLTWLSGMTYVELAARLNGTGFTIPNTHVSVHAVRGKHLYDPYLQEVQCLVYLLVSTT